MSFTSENIKDRKLVTPQVEREKKNEDVNLYALKRLISPFCFSFHLVVTRRCQ